MANFDFLSYVQQRNFGNFPAKYYPDLEFFLKNLYPALKLSGKNYTGTHGNGTPSYTPTSDS